MIPEAVNTVEFDRTAWRAAVNDLAVKAHATLPECNGRVDAAVTIVLAGDVTLQADGTARVASQSHGQMAYHIVNGSCDCKDYHKAPSNWCKHRIAAGLLKRANSRRDATLITQADMPAVEPSVEPSVEPAVMAPDIAPEHIVEIQGKRFVRVVGLLALAHARGLSSFTVDWTFNDATLSLAKAVVVFPFGTFTECGDATPDNVTKKVAPHFRRVALTRASARALRNALNIDMVSLEELAE